MMFEGVFVEDHVAWYFLTTGCIVTGVILSML